MDLNEFKDLEEKVKKPNFNKDYKGLNTILKALSFLGNAASIFLASFFVTTLLGVAIENIYVVWGIAITSLTGLELTKRVIFYRFSRDFIRTKKIFSSSVAPMLFFTLMLISLSFYSSLSGAKKFSSKADQIETVAETQIDNFSDSTNAYYQDKIDFYEQQTADLFAANKKIDDQVEKLLEEHPTWSNTAKRLREPQKENLVTIEKNDSKIKELKAERDQVIADYEEDINADSSEDINKNKSDSYIFIATSTLIELLILIGIYFNNLFNFRSYRDIKKKLLHDDNFKQYYKYLEIIGVLYLNRAEKDEIPDTTLMIKLLKMNKVYIREEELKDAISLFEAMQIIENNGEHTYILKEKEEAEKEMRSHFNITE